MRHYLLSVHGVTGEELPPPETIRQMFDDVAAFNDQLRAADAWVFGGGLQPPESATVVLVKAGDVVMTDGPFMETKEHLGGFWVIRTDDLDEALDWAVKATVACRRPVEVRPMEDDVS